GQWGRVGGAAAYRPVLVDDGCGPGGAGGGGDVDAHVGVGGVASGSIVGILQLHVLGAAVVATNHEQLVGDEGGGQPVVVLAGEGGAVAGGIHHHHIGMFPAQPQEEFFQQFLVTGHGDTGAQQRIHRVAMDIAGADTVDTPAPVQYARALLDQVDRGSDIGGDTRVRPPVDDDIEARADQVQPTQEAVAAAVIPTGGEYAGDCGAMPIGCLGVPCIDAGALGIG